MAIDLGISIGRTLKEEHKEEMHIGASAFDTSYSVLWDVFITNFWFAEMPSLGETLRDELGGHIETKIGPHLEMTLLFPDLGDAIPGFQPRQKNTFIWCIEYANMKRDVRHYVWSRLASTIWAETQGAVADVGGLGMTLQFQLQAGIEGSIARNEP